MQLLTRPQQVPDHPREIELDGLDRTGMLGPGHHRTPALSAAERAGPHGTTHSPGTQAYRPGGAA
jgi:hypothetical protein